MNVCHAVHHGRPPLIGSFATPFKPGPTRLQLFRLGLLNAALLSVIATVVMLAGGERAQQQDEVPWDLIVLQMLLYAPVLAMMWFAPPLVGWNGLTAAKAVFEPDMSSMASMFPPVGIAYYIWQAILSGITLVITSTVAPTIYRQITGGEPAVFD